MSPSGRLPTYYQAVSTAGFEPPPAYTPRIPENSSQPQHVRLYNCINYLPAPERKRILEDLCQLHNASVVSPNDKLALFGQCDLGYPKLEKWIAEKLDFIDYRRVAAFAFASGHFTEFQEARSNFSGQRGGIAKTSREFFLNYFLKEGYDPGIQRLYSIMQHCGILTSEGQSRLNQSLAVLDAEVLPESSWSVNCNFDYPAVFRCVNEQLTNENITTLEFLFNIDDESLEKEVHIPQVRVYALLHKLACRGHTTLQFIRGLESIGQSALAKKLIQTLSKSANAQTASMKS